MDAWHIVAEGESLETCGIPQAYHTFYDGTRVWGPTQCTRRSCPSCADHRYVQDAADDITRTVMGWVAEILSKGGLYDEFGRSLKIYHYIYSRKQGDDNLRAGRKACRETLRAAGMLAGYTITHPYRGDHKEDAEPGQIRKAMGRSALSLHYHGITIGYWSEPQKDCYYQSQVIADIRTWRYQDAQIVTRDRMMAKLLYDLNHAGWYGERGQCVSQWGSISGDRLKPDEPGIWLKHPIDTLDGEPIWEKRHLEEGDWHELQNIIQDWKFLRAIGEDPPIEDYLPEGKNVGMYQFYPLSKIDTMPDHSTWAPWRETIAGVVLSLIPEHLREVEGNG